MNRFLVSAVEYFFGGGLEGTLSKEEVGFTCPLKEATSCEGKVGRPVFDIWALEGLQRNVEWMLWMVNVEDEFLDVELWVTLDCQAALE